MKTLIIIAVLLAATPALATDTRIYTETGGMGVIEKGVSEGHKSYHLIGLEFIKDEISLSLEGFLRGEPADEDPEILQMGAAAELKYTALTLSDWFEPYLAVSYNHWARDRNLLYGPEEDQEELIYFAAASGGVVFRKSCMYVDLGTIIPFWSNTQSGNFGIDSGIGVTLGRFDIGYRYKRVVFSNHHFERGDNDM